MLTYGGNWVLFFKSAKTFWMSPNSGDILCDIKKLIFRRSNEQNSTCILIAESAFCWHFKSFCVIVINHPFKMILLFQFIHLSGWMQEISIFMISIWHVNRHCLFTHIEQKSRINLTRIFKIVLLAFYKGSLYWLLFIDWSIQRHPFKK